MTLTHHPAYIICSWATFDIYFTGFAPIFSSPGHMSYNPGLDYSSRDGVNRCSGQCRGSTHSEGECFQGEQNLPLMTCCKSTFYELNLMKPFPLTPCFCCIRCWFISPQLSGFMGWFGHLLTEWLVRSEGFLIVWCCWRGWPTALFLISLWKLLVLSHSSWLLGSSFPGDM